MRAQVATSWYWKPPSREGGTASPHSLPAQLGICCIAPTRDRDRDVARAGSIERLDQDRMVEASDEDLMVAIARGEQPAFQILMRRYLPRALGLARRILGNDADAEEVVQEALLRLWVHAPRWRPAAAFRTWFYRVVVNLCLNRKRRAPFAALDDVEEPIDPGTDASVEFETRQTEGMLAAAIAGLPERQRAAIILTYHEGLPNAETATVLGTSVSGVETLLVRARRSLRKALGPVLEIK